MFKNRLSTFYECKIGQIFRTSILDRFLKLLLDSSQNFLKTVQEHLGTLALETVLENFKNITSWTFLVQSKNICSRTGHELLLKCSRMPTIGQKFLTVLEQVMNVLLTF